MPRPGRLRAVARSDGGAWGNRGVPVLTVLGHPHATAHSGADTWLTALTCAGARQGLHQHHFRRLGLAENRSATRFPSIDRRPSCPRRAAQPPLPFDRNGTPLPTRQSAACSSASSFPTTLRLGSTLKRYARSEHPRRRAREARRSRAKLGNADQNSWASIWQRPRDRTACTAVYWVNGPKPKVRHGLALQSQRQRPHRPMWLDVMLEIATSLPHRRDARSLSMCLVKLAATVPAAESPRASHHGGEGGMLNSRSDRGYLAR